MSIIICIFALWIGWFGHQSTRGKFVAPSTFEMTNFIKSTDKMANRKVSKEEFILRSKEIHGNKYDYSKVVYINTTTKVCIICPIHGEFWQTPKAHMNGQGCPVCGKENQRRNVVHTNGRKLVHGVGVNDSPTPITENGKSLQAYQTWINMIKRCYGEKQLLKNPSYKECTVCNEWLRFSNFKKWFDDPANGYHEGYQLDKDFLVKGNKVYSPDTCCFVPHEINTLIIKCDKSRGKTPMCTVLIGCRYYVYFRKERNRIYLGVFDTINEAFQAYKQEKERYIKEVAEKYYKDRKITERVYNAMMNYQVEITD